MHCTDLGCGGAASHPACDSTCNDSFILLTAERRTAPVFCTAARTSADCTRHSRAVTICRDLIAAHELISSAQQPLPEGPDCCCGMQGLRAVYPKPGSKGAVEVLPADLARLDEGEFLNDTIIDFWMRSALITFSHVRPMEGSGCFMMMVVPALRQAGMCRVPAASCETSALCLAYRYVGREHDWAAG